MGKLVGKAAAGWDRCSVTTVLCVLRSGGEYRPAHVARLADQVQRNSPAGTAFCCLTDQVPEVTALGVEAQPLGQPWPKWFAKLCTFYRPGPCLYLDLDVSVIGNLGPMLAAAHDHALIASADFWHPEMHGINSSVMAWNGDAGCVPRAFAEDPTGFAKTYSTKQRWGDQAFVRDHWPYKIACWQDSLPGMVLSFKRGVLLGRSIRNCRVLVSHGQPRPWGRGGADEWLRQRGRLVA